MNAVLRLLRFGAPTATRPGDARALALVVSLLAYVLLLGALWLLIGTLLTPLERPQSEAGPAAVASVFLLFAGGLTAGLAASLWRGSAAAWWLCTVITALTIGTNLLRLGRDGTEALVAILSFAALGLLLLHSRRWFLQRPTGR